MILHMALKLSLRSKFSVHHNKLKIEPWMEYSNVLEIVAHIKIIYRVFEIKYLLQK